MCPMPVPSLEALFVEHVGPSMARHLALLRAVEGLPCQIGLKRGDVRFGDRWTFPVQLLGIEDPDGATWTWSWALPATKVAPPLTRTALELRAWGEDHGVDLFYVPRFGLAGMTGDQIAIVSCGLADAAAFLVAETELGTAFLLFPDLQGQIPTRHSAAFLAEILPEVLTTYTLPDHPAVVRSLLRFQGFRIEEDKGAWQARREDGSRITVSFDSQRRISKLQVQTAG